MDEQVIKALRAKYYRDWRKKNPDKVREINARYWKRRAEKLAEKSQNSEDVRADVADATDYRH